MLRLVVGLNPGLRSSDDQTRGLGISKQGSRLRRWALTEAAWSAALRGGDPQSELYLVDPRGFLVLRYAAGFDPRDLQADLERLLRISEDEPA